MARINRNVRKSLEIVIPVFNEAAVVEQFHERLEGAIRGLPYRVRVRFVDDGSSDGTGEVLEEIASRDPRVVVTHLSRNFGHQAAITAGLDLADSDATITMDGDGQHPPEIIPELVAQFQAGYDVVLTQRLDPRRRLSLKHATSTAFYWLINKIADTRIPPASGDFRLLARSVVTELRRMREFHRFLRGMIAWMGYRTVVVPYHPAPRIAGSSKYSRRKMMRLASEAIFSFSLAPLGLTLAIGALFLLLACAEGMYVLSFWLTGREEQLVPGWSSLMFMILVVGAVLMIGLGLVGVYVGYIFQQVKGRQVYLVREEDPTPQEERATRKAQGVRKKTAQARRKRRTLR